ncbi:type IV pilus biogenesis protein PilM [Pseudomonas fluorescens]|uniref:type IV pilus biogenesis protein PilM n=1 Tax=Pseudomonas fluorescens TaxID=294 RepID=UPI0009B6C5F5|nr:type IV pilus biogenesis protein PilM [Pseudomonas fluorescens]
MPLLYLLLALMFSLSVMSHVEKTSKNRGMAVAEIEAVSGSMLLYRNLVASYASANPAQSGSVSDASLSMPNWYVKNPGFGNFITPGGSYVFYTQSLPGLVGALAKKTESTNVGVNQNGVLISPNKVNPGIVLPAQIPNGAVVLVQ